VESALHFVPVSRRGGSVPTWAEVLHNGPISQEEALRLAWGFESLHPPLPLSHRLMRVLGAIIEIVVLAMFYPWKKLALGGSVALEFVGDDHARHGRQSFEQLAEELFRGLLVSTTLDQDFQHIPEIAKLSGALLEKCFRASLHHG
jgi:hypothetical protein